LWRLIRVKINRGCVYALEQRVQHPKHPCAEQWQGGISLFWRTSETYEIKEVELCGPGMLLFQLVLGATRWYILGCYILPTNLTTLMHVKQAWLACPKGCLPILLGDLNVNLAASCNKRDNTIAKQVDAMV
jgi:hypothetical protein